MASYKGHLRGGIFAGIVLLILTLPHGFTSLTPIDALHLSVSLLIGSLLPDIDHPHSVLGRRLPFISKPLYRLCGHRSLTHSIFFLIICSLIPNLLNLEMISTGLFIGILSHILLDLMCPGGGVAFLYPLYPYRIKLLKKFHIRKRRHRRKKWY